MNLVQQLMEGIHLLLCVLKRVVNKILKILKKKIIVKNIKIKINQNLKLRVFKAPPNMFCRKIILSPYFMYFCTPVTIPKNLSI